MFTGSITDLQAQLAAQHYVADRGLAVSLFLALRLQRPLFLEGEAGVGKTALAAAAAAPRGADLIRLQGYEGLDISHAVYEWDYARQLLELRILEAADALDRGQARRELYSEPFLLKRPLLQAIDPARTQPAVVVPVMTTVSMRSWMRTLASWVPKKKDGFGLTMTMSPGCGATSSSISCGHNSVAKAESSGIAFDSRRPPVAAE